MPADAGDRHLDFTKIARYLEALANPSRLELLHLLRQPRAAGEIRLRPSIGGGMRPDRPITRQAVRKHLAKLEEAGVITAQRGAGGHEDYVVNHQMLFALVEEMRRVTQLAPAVSLAPLATMTGAGAEAGPRGKGSRVIVVHGAREGQTFPLDARTAGPAGTWVVGRRRGLAVAMDHDPFVSQQHCELAAGARGWELRDLSTNKNGTELNWEPLPRGGAAPLQTGDVIGVGRTLLLFREA